MANSNNVAVQANKGSLLYSDKYYVHAQHGTTATNALRLLAVGRFCKMRLPLCIGLRLTPYVLLRRCVVWNVLSIQVQVQVQVSNLWCIVKSALHSKMYCLSNALLNLLFLSLWHCSLELDSAILGLESHHENCFKFTVIFLVND